MYTLAERPKENKSSAVANFVTQKKSNVRRAVGFVDNRPEAVIQRKLQEMVSNRFQGMEIASSIQNSENAIQLAGTGAKVKRLVASNATIATAGAVASTLIVAAGLGPMAIGAAAALVGWYGGSAAMYLYHRYGPGESGEPINASAFIADTIYGRTTHFPWVSAWGYKTLSEATVPKGKYIYVVSMDRKLYYASSSDRTPGEHNYMRHSQLAGGAHVRAAGYLEVGKDGDISVDNDSGHYTPLEETIGIAVDLINGFGHNASQRVRKKER